MNIKILKELIADLPDDMEIVVGGFDHSYYSAHACVAPAEKHDRFQYSEWYEDNGQEEPVEVLVVG